MNIDSSEQAGQGASFVSGCAGRENPPPRYFSYRRYLRGRFGAAVARIALNAGFTCPNRDGTAGTEGCAFCDNRGFSPAAMAAGTPLEQLTKAISQMRGRAGAFIAYLQPYSNTYASVERLREVCEPLIAVAGVVGLALGTRPDCFSVGIYDYLSSVSGRTYLSVELGLQSSHDETLRRVNRGHTFGDFVRCVEALSRRGIETVAHVILGLPGETDGMMAATARRLAELPVSGVKIHQLMILRGARFAQSYERGEIAVQDIACYAHRVAVFLSLLRPDQYIHRLAAESQPGQGLLAPLWSADKHAALRAIRGALEALNIRQGCACGRESAW